MLERTAHTIIRSTVTEFIDIEKKKSKHSTLEHTVTVNHPRYLRKKMDKLINMPSEAVNHLLGRSNLFLNSIE